MRHQIIISVEATKKKFYLGSVLGKRKSKRLIKAKATRLLMLSCKNYDWL